jgi:hypothetical protein
MQKKSSLAGTPSPLALLRSYEQLMNGRIRSFRFALLVIAFVISFANKADDLLLLAHVGSLFS